MVISHACLELHSVLIQLYVVTLRHIFYWPPQSALLFLKCIIMMVEQGAHFFFEDFVTFEVVGAL